MKLRVAVVAAWSGLAVVLAHTLSYRLVYDDPHARMHALEGSGHSWYGLLFPVVAAMLFTALAGTWVSSRKSTRTVSALQMYAFAASGFILVEFFERFLHLGSLAEVWHNVATGSGFLPILVALVLLLPIVPLFYVAAKAIAILARRRPRLSVATLTLARLETEFQLPAFFSFTTAPRGPPCAVAQVPALR
jgi:hypothetical protein